MSIVCAVESVSLDGVMQAPGRPDEDTRGGFQHGGWAIPYSDEVLGRVMGEGMTGEGAMLFGRRTYEDLGSYWPNQTDNPYTDVLNNARKYVASRTLTEPLFWQNSALLPGDAADAVADLRGQDGPNLTVLGSGELVRSLQERDLVDQYVLLIHPLILGSGRRLFENGLPAAQFTLTRSVPTTTGVIIAFYDRARPAGGHSAEL
jgi:dihydrofolate reductase